MSARRVIVALSMSIVAIACNQRGSKQPPQAGSGTGSAASAAIDASVAPPPIDASLSDGTLQLVGIDVLTTPPALFQQRAAGAGPKPMEPLVAAAKAAVRGVDEAKPGALGDSVVVWIAIRPGKHVRAWIACPRKAAGADLDAARAEIAGRLTMAPAPEVTGPVAFAVTFDRSGARPPGHDIPLPPELEQVRGPTADAPTPEQLIERAWRK